MIALDPHVLDIFDDDFNASSKNLSFESSNQCVMMVVMSNFPLTITLRRVIAFVTVFVKNVVTFVISRLATLAWINKDS